MVVYQQQSIDYSDYSIVYSRSQTTTEMWVQPKSAKYQA